jgi:hypothetical protein
MRAFSDVAAGIDTGVVSVENAIGRVAVTPELPDATERI